MVRGLSFQHGEDVEKTAWERMAWVVMFFAPVSSEPGLVRLDLFGLERNDDGRARSEESILN